jgi:hypothetical protein
MMDDLIMPEPVSLNIITFNEPRISAPYNSF